MSGEGGGGGVEGEREEGRNGWREKERGRVVERREGRREGERLEGKQVLEEREF